MKYKIVYDDSADKHSAHRKYVVVSDFRLGAKINRLQAAGNVIVWVEQEGA